MNARTFGLVGLWAVTVIIAAVAIAKLHRTRALNQELRAELQAQNAAALEARRGSEQIDRSANLTSDEKMELLRLRNEVTQLKATVAASRDAVKSALENRDEGMRRVAVADKEAPPAPQEVAANQQGGDYDPLAFYRKNPELMKRYFPHLYRAQMEQQPDAAVQPIEPQEAQPVPQSVPPELMRRYFPHLLNQQPQAGAAPGGTLPPEPAPNQ